MFYGLLVKGKGEVGLLAIKNLPVSVDNGIGNKEPG